MRRTSFRAIHCLWHHTDVQLLWITSDNAFNFINSTALNLLYSANSAKPWKPSTNQRKQLNSIAWESIELGVEHKIVHSRSQWKYCLCKELMGWINFRKMFWFEMGFSAVIHNSWVSKQRHRTNSHYLCRMVVSRSPSHLAEKRAVWILVYILERMASILFPNSSLFNIAYTPIADSHENKMFLNK